MTPNAAMVAAGFRECIYQTASNRRQDRRIQSSAHLFPPVIHRRGSSIIFCRRLNMFDMPATVRVFRAVPTADLRNRHHGLADWIDATSCIRILIPEGASAR
jgi:hypothetical protein